MKTILIVDDDRRMRRTLQIAVQRLGYESVAMADGASAYEAFCSSKFDLVLTDLKMPEMSGIELIERIRKIDSDAPVIVLTAFGTVDTAVQAMKLGAFDFLLKPFDFDALEIIIQRALEAQDTRARNAFLREALDDSRAGLSRLSSLPGLAEVATLISKIGPSNATVLVTGETGTGKEVVARTIHETSPREDALFVPINCAAVPADLLESELFGHAKGAFTGAQSDRVGKIELANGGTLFLDEIGDMPMALQAKLLRVLEESVIEPVGSNRRVNVDIRLVSATNRDLREAIEKQEFREDLLYRINTVEVPLPPLRDRPEDVQVLAKRFLQQFALELRKPELQLSPQALEILRAYRWPGNIRELRNVMERAVVLSGSDIVGERAFSNLEVAAARPVGNETAAAQTLEEAVGQLERQMILDALAGCSSKGGAARRLGISERTLWNKMKRYGL